MICYPYEENFPLPSLEDGIAVREIDFADFRLDPSRTLELGDALVGINGTRDLDLLESAIAQRVARSGVINASMNGSFAAKPLGSQFRPKNFYGELSDGTALVLESDEYERTITLVVTLNLVSNGHPIGRVMREARYTPGSNHYIGVQRKLSKPQGMKESRKLAEELNKESGSKATRLAKYAIAHLYSSGRTT